MGHRSQKTEIQIVLPWNCMDCIVGSIAMEAGKGTFAGVTEPGN